jgi:molecular chaperone IbpA
MSDLFSQLDYLLNSPHFPFITYKSTGRNYPPYNIVSDENGQVRLDMAVAGFTKDRLSVKMEGNQLVIRGSSRPKSKDDEPKLTYHAHGIGDSAFVRAFDVHPGTMVKSVSLKDGILTVSLVHETQSKTKEFTIE